MGIAGNLKNHIFDLWKVIFHQETKMKNKATLFIICGMPASGKTTFTEKS